MTNIKDAKTNENCGCAKGRELSLQPLQLQELHLLIVHYTGALGRSVRGRHRPGNLPLKTISLLIGAGVLAAASPATAPAHARHDHADAGQTGGGKGGAKEEDGREEATKKAPARKPAAKTATRPMEPGMTMPMDHSQTGHAQMGQMPMEHGQMQMGEHAGHAMAMTGALGPYPMERESSGTAWQPDTSGAHGLDEAGGRLDAHGARRSQPRLRSSIGPARRRQGLR